MENRPPHQRYRPPFWTLRTTEPLGYWDEGGAISVSGPARTLRGPWSKTMYAIVFAAFVSWACFAIGLQGHVRWLRNAGGVGFAGSILLLLTIPAFVEQRATVEVGPAGVTLTIRTVNALTHVRPRDGWRGTERWNAAEVKYFYVARGTKKRPYLAMELADGRGVDLSITGTVNDLSEAAGRLSAALVFDVQKPQALSAPGAS
jgi:hypothetical protein